MNIRFEYLYRDAGNFKNWGEVVFSNPRNFTADSIALMADPALIDHVYFVAAKVDIANLHFAEHIDELDHDWHEVHAFQTTSDPPNDAKCRNIEEFVATLRSASIA